MEDPKTDQWLDMLEMELANKRAQRLSREENRKNIRIVGLLIIIIGATGALIILYIILTQMEGGSFKKEPKVDRRESR